MVRLCNAVSAHAQNGDRLRTCHASPMKRSQKRSRLRLTMHFDSPHRALSRSTEDNQLKAPDTDVLNIRSPIYRVASVSARTGTRASKVAHALRQLRGKRQQRPSGLHRRLGAAQLLARHRRVDAEQAQRLNRDDGRLLEHGLQAQRRAREVVVVLALGAVRLAADVEQAADGEDEQDEREVVWARVVAARDGRARRDGPPVDDGQHLDDELLPRDAAEEPARVLEVRLGEVRRALPWRQVLLDERLHLEWRADGREGEGRGEARDLAVDGRGQRVAP